MDKQLLMEALAPFANLLPALDDGDNRPDEAAVEIADRWVYFQRPADAPKGVVPHLAPPGSPLTLGDFRRAAKALAIIGGR